MRIRADFLKILWTLSSQWSSPWQASTSCKAVTEDANSKCECVGLFLAEQICQYGYCIRFLSSDMCIFWWCKN